MREKRNFAERTKALRSDEVRKKYFLVYEGKDTELLYFDAVNELRREIKINPLIELVPIVRSYSEDGWSNPKKIVDRMSQNIQESQTGVISYETMLNWIMEYFQDEGYIANNRTFAKTVWRTLQWICEEKLKVSLNDNIHDLNCACQKLFECLNKETEFSNLVIDIAKIVNYGKITYEENFDKICFIVDRDKESFTAEQYDYVILQCEEKHYGFFLTNPCFEFWLLLHFTDVGDLDSDKLLENPLVTAKYRYAENELRKRIPRFKKSKYDALSLVRNINTAITNEEYFCEEIIGLKTNVGSNIGILIKEMQVGNG